MLEAFYSALTGLRVSERRIEAGANNLANLQTPGFKKSEVDVVDMLHGGANVSSISRVATQGPVMTTGNPIDLAISGGGYFQVQLPNGGTGYTRAGSFKIDGQGRLATSNGEVLQPQINIPPGATALSIGANGEVSAFVGGQTRNIGQINLANFNNPSGLAASGGNLFTESGASGAPVVGLPGEGGFGELVAGGLEMSNVDISEEFVSQISSKAAFKASINVIRVADEMTGTLLNLTA